MGYGNIDKINISDGEIVDISYTKEGTADRLQKNVSLDRVAAAERAQKLQAQKELDQYIKDVKRAEFLEFE